MADATANDPLTFYFWHRDSEEHPLSPYTDAELDLMDTIAMKLLPAIIGEQRFRGDVGDTNAASQAWPDGVYSGESWPSTQLSEVARIELIDGAYAFASTLIETRRMMREQRNEHIKKRKQAGLD